MRPRSAISQDMIAWGTRSDLVLLEALLDIRDLLAAGARRGNGGKPDKRPAPRPDRDPDPLED